MTASDWSDDFDDLLAELIAANAEFLIVGAHALAAQLKNKRASCWAEIERIEL